MTYIVNDKCIMCKYTDCVEVCLLIVFKGENMLVIHPDECIDCGVCEPECLTFARFEPEARLAETQCGYGRDLANIGQKIDAMPEADAKQDETGKFEKYFSDKPGQGA